MRFLGLILKTALQFLSQILKTAIAVFLCSFLRIAVFSHFAGLVGGREEGKVSLSTLSLTYIQKFEPF